MRSPRCRAILGGRPEAPARCSSRLWSGTWPRPSVSVCLHRRVRRGADAESARSPTGAGAGSRRISNSSWPGPPLRGCGARGLCHHPHEVRERFPGDRLLVDLGVESYLGVPLLDGDGRVLGHLAVFDEQPMPPEPRPALHLPDLRRGRNAVELERLRVEQLLAGERAAAYRELYEGRPTPTWRSAAIDGSSASITASTQLLGVPASELVGRPVLALFAETPASEASGRGDAPRPACAGREISGRELEMCRRCGGTLWVSVWMRPAPRGGGRIAAVHSIWGRHHRPGSPPRPSTSASSSRTSTSRKRSSRTTTSRRSSVDPRAARRARQGQPGGADRRHRAHHRRDGDRQGADRGRSTLTAARPSR